MEFLERHVCKFKSGEFTSCHTPFGVPQHLLKWLKWQHSAEWDEEYFETTRPFLCVCPFLLELQRHLQNFWTVPTIHQLSNNDADVCRRWTLASFKLDDQAFLLQPTARECSFCLLPWQSSLIPQICLKPELASGQVILVGIVAGMRIRTSFGGENEASTTGVRESPQQQQRRRMHSPRAVNLVWLLAGSRERPGFIPPGLASWSLH